ncbi:Gfo/Idh/MocA family oxidoreductase [Chloroflexota bacterium]
MTRVGVIGLGEMGQHHARLYSQLDCELVGVVDVDPERAKEIGEKYHTAYYTDYRDLLPNVDAVSIAVPTTLHHKVATKFLKQGIHCLVEKPIAFDVDEAEEMIHTARESAANLAIGHIEQFNPVVVKLKQLIDNGTLGKLLIVSTRRVGPSVPRIRDVGIIIDSASHDIGVVNYLVGNRPVSIYSKASSLKHSKDDHAIIVLDYGETTACIEVNWFTPQKVRTLVATGSEGITYLDYIEQTIKLCNSHSVQDIDIEKAEPLRLEIEDFLRSVEEKRTPSVTGKEGLEILQVALEASSQPPRTGGVVNV